MSRIVKLFLSLLLLISAFALIACGDVGTDGTDGAGGAAASDAEAVAELQVADIEIDWSDYPVILDGEELAESSTLIFGDEVWPTHASLAPIAEALGFEVSQSGQEMSFEGLKGPVEFRFGSQDYTVAGETVILDDSAFAYNGEVYVPILFFRDVMGAQSAYFSSGNIHINTSGESDMY